MSKYTTSVSKLIKKKRLVPVFNQLNEGDIFDKTFKVPKTGIYIIRYESKPRAKKKRIVELTEPIFCESVKLSK